MVSRRKNTTIPDILFALSGSECIGEKTYRAVPCVISDNQFELGWALRQFKRETLCDSLLLTSFPYFKWNTICYAAIVNAQGAIAIDCFVFVVLMNSFPEIFKILFFHNFTAVSCLCIESFIPADLYRLLFLTPSKNGSELFEQIWWSVPLVR